MKNLKIWIATGGTGGHVFPALAVAEELIKQKHSVTISSDARAWEMVNNNKPSSTAVAFVWASGVGARGIFEQLIALSKIGMSTIALTLRFLIFRPDRIVAFGGYSGVPAIIAGKICRIPVFLHEQNAHIGRANKFAMRFVDTLMTSFPDVQGIGNKEYGISVVYTGLPVRKEFLNKKDYRLSTKDFRLLVTGGSLGAQIIDDVVPVAIDKLPTSLKKKLFITHQTRPAAVPKMQRYYAANGIRANVVSFIKDMAGEMSAADLVISRAGASTVVELQTLGRPAILVPLTINPDQPANAAAFAKSGAGFNVSDKKFTAKWLSLTIAELADNPARLSKMADKARVENNAVNNIIDVLVSNEE